MIHVAIFVRFSTAIDRDGKRAEREREMRAVLERWERSGLDLPPEVGPALMRVRLPFPDLEMGRREP